MNAEQVHRKWIQFKGKLTQYGSECLENVLGQTEERHDKISGERHDRYVISTTPTCLTTILNGPGELIGPRRGQGIPSVSPAEAT